MNIPARNKLVGLQLLALYSNPPDSHNAQSHRQMDDKIMPIACHTV